MLASDETLEKEWLNALRTGDEQALRRIFDRYYARLLSDIAHIVEDEDLSQDLAQEVFVELWRKREQLDIHSSLSAYLKRAGINRALNYLKSNRRYSWEEPELQGMADTSLHDLQQKMRQERLEEAVRAAIETLPEKCRLVFSLSRFEKLSHREIAEQLGISVKTIENQITKAMRTLRELLEKHPDLSSVVIYMLNIPWWS